SASAPASSATAGGAPAPVAGAGTPVGAQAPTPNASQPTGEKVVVTTDVMKVEFDSAGGIISRLELLKHDGNDGKPVVLFEHDAARSYLARSGLIGGDFPNHTAQFTAEPGPRDLGSANALTVTLSSEQNGVKLVKRYTMQR